MLLEIKGNILEFDECQYIAHQCNCLSVRSEGMASKIFEKFPWANIYLSRPQQSNVYNLPDEQKPGNLLICGNGKDQRYVINMLAQVYPGKSYPGSIDSSEKRIEYFKSCLSKIGRIRGLKEIAFNYKIGCKLARGNWDEYKKMLIDFANLIHPKGVQVYLVIPKEE